jgi:DNA-binding NarL/FixJ family response regulator
MLAGVALRCLIVDDNADFLEAARELLERDGIKVVGVASNSMEALQRAAELRPEVTLVDVYLGDESGFNLARRLADGADGVRSAVILISTYAERDFADLIAASPVAGFLSKSDLSRSAVDKTLGRTDNG